MTNADYRHVADPNAEIETPRALPRMTRNAVKSLRVSLPDVGVVCIATMPLSVSYRVFEHLMSLCDCSPAAKLVRAKLMDDDSLHLGDKEWSWFWIVLELLSVSVVSVEGGMLKAKEEKREVAA